MPQVKNPQSPQGRTFDLPPGHHCPVTTRAAVCSSTTAPKAARRQRQPHDFDSTFRVHTAANMSTNEEVSFADGADPREPQLTAPDRSGHRGEFPPTARARARCHDASGCRTTYPLQANDAGCMRPSRSRGPRRHRGYHASAGADGLGLALPQDAQHACRIAWSRYFVYHPHSSSP